MTRKVLEALKVWRLFPTQIASDLQIHCNGRHIREWHRDDFTLSSRELLELLDGLPEMSKFKEATERTFRVVEYRGDNPELKGKLLLMHAVGEPPADVEVIDEFVDWTFDRKLAARTVRELAALNARGQDSRVDFSHLLEPLDEILTARELRTRAAVAERGREHILSGLYGYETR